MNANHLMNCAKASMFASALLLAGSACANEALPTDLQNQAAAIRYVSCLAAADTRTDDGISDPAVIAARIAPLCADEFARELAAYGAGLSQNDWTAYREATLAQQPQLVASVVIATRQWNSTHKPRTPHVAETN
jgi:hypothetical protein